MAMLSQSLPVEILGCPAGVCRGQAAARPQTSWKAVAAGFAAGALVVSLGAAFVGVGRAPGAQAEKPVAAAHWEAYVQAQTPREIPREWRYEIKGVNVDGMFRKHR